MAKDWKERLGVVYSTNPEFNYSTNKSEETDTPPPDKQTLSVTLDRKQRKGKMVTLIRGFLGSEVDLQELGKKLKNKCGVGGSSKDGEIMVQGDQQQKVKALLQEWGYRVK